MTFARLSKEDVGTSALKRMSEAWFEENSEQFPALIKHAAAKHGIPLEGWFFQLAEPPTGPVRVSRRYIDRLVEGEPMFQQSGRHIGRADRRALAVLSTMVFCNARLRRGKQLTATANDFVDHFEAIHQLLLELESDTSRNVAEEVQFVPALKDKPVVLRRIDNRPRREVRGFNGSVNDDDPMLRLPDVQPALQVMSPERTPAKEGYGTIAASALRQLAKEDGNTHTAYYNMLCGLLHEVTQRLEKQEFEFQKNGDESWALLEEVPVARFEAPPTASDDSLPHERLQATLWRLGARSLPEDGVPGTSQQQIIAHVLWAFSEKITAKDATPLHPRQLKRILHRI